jgi:hypothetical protein
MGVAAVTLACWICIEATAWVRCSRVSGPRTGNAPSILRDLRITLGHTHLVKDAVWPIIYKLERHVRAVGDARDGNIDWKALRALAALFGQWHDCRVEVRLL